MTYMPRRVRRAARKWLLSISKVNITHKYNETERAAVMVKCSKPTQVWLPACHSNYLWVSPGKAYFQIGPMDMGLADFLTNCAILHMYPHVELGKVYSTMELHGLPQFGFQHSNTTNRIRIITKGCLDKSNVVSSVWFDFNISKRIWKKKLDGILSFGSHSTLTHFISEKPKRCHSVFLTGIQRVVYYSTTLVFNECSLHDVFADCNIFEF